MSIRHVVRRVAVALAATAAVGAISTMAFTGTAGAAGPTQGTSVPNSALPCSEAAAADSGSGCPYTSFVGGTPFSSGQQINVVVPANGLFNDTEALSVLECSAPNGVI